MFWRRLALVTAAVVCGISPVSVAAESSKNVVQELVGLFSRWSGDTSNAAVFSEAARYIDYTGMAERTLGKPQWDELSAQQKEQFVTTFRKLVELRYYKRWHKIFYKGKIQYLGESTTGGDTRVKTVLTVGKQESMVYWSLHPKNGEPAVINMTVNNKDLLGRLKNRFQKRLAKHDFNNLLAWMKRHADDEEDEQDEASPTASRQ